MKFSELYENQLLVDAGGKLWRVKSIFVSTSQAQLSTFVVGLLSDGQNGPFEHESIVSETSTQMKYFSPVPVVKQDCKPASAGIEKQPGGLKISDLHVDQILTDRTGCLWRVVLIYLDLIEIRSGFVFRKPSTFIAEMIEPAGLNGAIRVSGVFDEASLVNFERCATAIS